MEAYLSKFGRQINPDSGPCNQNRQCSLKREEFLKEKSSREGLLKNCYGISLSEICELINDKNGENFLSNKEIKLFLAESFGSLIQFCSSELKNESLMVSSSEIELQDIVKKIRSLDNIKTAAATIRQSRLDLDFGLDDKLCDAEELKEARRKKVMPDVLLTFFSTLFNLRLGNLLQGIDEGSCANMDDENGNDDTDQTDG